jgi:hypothetical protein
MRRFLVLAISLSAAAACGSDGSSGGTTGPSGPQATIPYSVSADSVNLARTATIGTSLATVVNVQLNGLPAVNVTVTWVVPKGNGTLSGTTSTTDALGNATVTWKISDTVRTNTLTATAGTGSVNLTATGTAGPATTLTAASADSTSLVAGAATLITVHAADSFGNGVPGVVITWSASGGSLSLLSSTTGAAGNASVVFSTSSTPATYSVTAAAGGVFAPLSFKVIGF